MSLTNTGRVPAPGRPPYGNDHEVVIVGAGPTGLALGCALRLQGVGCLVVEQRDGIDPRSRAVMVHAGGLEHLEALGVRDTLESRALRLGRIVFRLFDGAEHTVDFTHLPTRFPYYLNVPQPEIERVLEEAYLELGGALARGVQYLGHREDGGRTDVFLRGRSSDTGDTVLGASYLVGADGADSTVRARLGVDFPGATYPMDYFLAEGAPGPGLRSVREESAMFVGREGAVSVLPLPGGRTRLAGPVLPAHAQEGGPLDAVVFQEAVESLGFGDRLRLAHTDRITRYRVHERLASRYRAGRAFLTGDAAHLNSPAGGQAMNTGFADAADLAARLSAVLNGEGESVLDGYEAERRTAARRVARNTAIGDLLRPLKEHGAGRESDSALRSRLDALALEWSQLGPATVGGQR